MKPKPEGRTQLVGYAHMHGLVARISEARAMDLEALRRIVELHREATAKKNKQWGIDDASIASQLDTAATNAEKE